MKVIEDKAELLEALEASRGGAILLKGGNYGTLSLNSRHHPFSRFDSEVIIKSADVANPAVFANIHLRGVKNLSFVSIKLDYVFADGDHTWTSPFKIQGCSHIRVSNSIFDGDLAEGIDAVSDEYGTGRGVLVTKLDDTRSQHITITNNEFFNWMRAAVFADVDDLIVSENDVHSIRSDGFNFVTVNRVRIENNHIHDFAASPESLDHRDFIQFWTTNQSAPSTDITIRGNTLNSGVGLWTQSIFMRNERVDRGEAGPEMFYRNIRIENNLIHNAHTHGITVGEVDGLVIANNTLLHNADSGKDNSVHVPKIHLNPASVNVTLVNNITPWPIGGVKEVWSVANNVSVQSTDAAGEHYVGDMFVNALAGAKATVTDLKPKPGGLIEKLGVGVPIAADPPPDNLPSELLVQIGGGPDYAVYRRVSAA